MFLLISLVAAAALSVGACGAGDDAGTGAVKAAVKIKQLWRETEDVRYMGKTGYKLYKKADFDLDGRKGLNDNCPTVFNIDQANSDGDLLGDACDDAADFDGDGEEDAIDNCPVVANEFQVDFDDDGEGDACDDDMDGDGLMNRSVFEIDMDGDRLNNSFDPDIDGDGYINAVDRFDWDPAWAPGKFSRSRGA
jgi:hypothetical protein